MALFIQLKKMKLILIIFTTGKLACKFSFNDERFTSRAVYINNTLVQCPVPNIPPQLEGVVGVLEISLDGGIGYTNNSRKFQFKSASDATPCFAVPSSSLPLPVAEGGPFAAATEEHHKFYWLFLLLLVPLLLFLLWKLFSRNRKGEYKAPPAQEESFDVLPHLPPPSAPVRAKAPALVRAATAPPAPIEPEKKGKYKWEIAPSAYIGFGKGKMEVDWAGEAPQSAPHEQKRKRSLVQEQDSTGHLDEGAVAAKAKGDKNGLISKVEADHINEDAAPKGCWASIMSAFCCSSSSSSHRVTKKKKKAPPSLKELVNGTSSNRNVASSLAAHAADDSAAASIIPASSPAVPVKRKLDFANTTPQLGSRSQSVPDLHALAAAAAARGSNENDAALLAPNTNSLPPGWEALLTEQGQTYYENRELQVTQWEPPEVQ
jgi:hypothetical protein